jgi:hypothetical protein
MLNHLSRTPCRSSPLPGSRGCGTRPHTAAARMLVRGLWWWVGSLADCCAVVARLCHCANRSATQKLIEQVASLAGQNHRKRAPQRLGRTCVRFRHASSWNDRAIGPKIATVAPLRTRRIPPWDRDAPTLPTPPFRENVQVADVTKQRDTSLSRRILSDCVWEGQFATANQFAFSLRSISFK